MALSAAAASLAYLDARIALHVDYKLITSLGAATVKLHLREYRDKVSLFYILEEHAHSSSVANTPFFLYGGREWTYKETYEMVLRYGNWLKTTFDVAPAEIVAMDFMNSQDFVFIWFGLWSIGAQPAFINYNLSGQSLLHCVQSSSARLLLVDEDVKDKFGAELLNELAGQGSGDDKKSVEVIFFTPERQAQALTSDPTRYPDSVRSGRKLHDMAILIYTSGTTGLPKPAVVSWLKLNLAGRFASRWMGWGRKDRMYTVSFRFAIELPSLSHMCQCMPLYHSSSTVLGFTPCLYAKGSISVGRKFSTKTFWHDVRTTKATMIQYVGETCRYLLAAQPDIDPTTGEDLDRKNNVRLAFGNGLRPDVWNKFKDRFGIPAIAEFYAATEGPSGHWNMSKNDYSLGCIGRNGLIARWVLGSILAVVSLDFTTDMPSRSPTTGLCHRVHPGDPGELIYRLKPEDIKQEYQGYFNDPSASERKVIRDVFVKGDAWYRTGDVVRWDREGRWYFHDRIGDTFRWKSENVSTAEVGAVVGAAPHGCVKEANVYGVELPGHDGRAGCAAVVLEDGATTASETTGITSTDGTTVAAAAAVAPTPTKQTLADLAAHVRSSLPAYAVPIFLRVTTAMATTGTNKHQKHVLRSEGVDPALVARAGDAVYWLPAVKGSEEPYVPFTRADWDRLRAGAVKL
ncbi:MAG: hypothetical protein M1819_003020 [Sarea resinae]|nr:MAG: hypothetical protein M1819_003020 [Sarea resinae]